VDLKTHQRIFFQRKALAEIQKNRCIIRLEKKFISPDTIDSSTFIKGQFYSLRQNQYPLFAFSILETVTGFDVNRHP